MQRWVCKKCNKKWIYPVEKCIYCKGPIEKIVGATANVVGFTKVFVPSPMHPIVPYNIIILEDENGNRIPKKTMREYKIGDRYEEKTSGNGHAVSIVKTKYDVAEAVKKALMLIEWKPKKGAKILIKPNMEEAAYPYQAITTNPAVLEAVIQILKEQGVSSENITVAEQPNPGVDSKKALERSELGAVCEKHSIRFVNLAETEFETKTVDKYEFEISKEVLSKDIIINIPVLKTNSMIVASGALENMRRCLSNRSQEALMKGNPLEALAYLQKALPKYITLGDATIGMQGDGPLQSGEPAFLNLVLASRDPVALDKVFCELGMLPTAPYLKIAAQADIGQIENIEIVGDELEAIKYPLKQPRMKVRT